WITAVSNSGTESYPSNLITVTIPSQSAEQILFQGFENVPAFTEDIFSWQNLDLDDSATSEWEGISFPAETEPFGWLCFEPLATIPPLMEQPTFAGTKMLASLCAIPPPNNDWFISPPIHLGANSRLNFAAKSAFANFGLERMCVLISNTTSEIASFTPLNSGPYIAVPVQWTNYAYDLSAWDGQRIFLAWRCVSVDAMALFLDNIEVYSHSGWVRAEDLISPVSEFSLFPNPCKGSFTLQNKRGENFHLEIYNLKGQCLFQQNASKNFDSQTELAPLACGIYFLRLDQNGKKETLKLAVIK
ncbi:MAG: choice-of-anchor J domain-containing protein, partial [Candidatus Cloacimonas sp.]